MNFPSILITITMMFAMIGLGANAIIPNIDAQNVTNSSQDVLKGGITSIQNDATDNNTSWIVVGVYRIENLNSASPMFNASFYMVKTDGTSSHSHDIYDLVLNGQPAVNNNSTILNGITTVTMKDGPITDVPTNIKLIGDAAISIWLDPTKINNHFRDTPIYGTQDLKCVDSPEYCK